MAPTITVSAIIVIVIPVPTTTVVSRIGTFFPGGHRRSGGSAQPAAKDSSAPTADLVADEGTESTAQCAAEGGVQALIIGHRRRPAQARTGKDNSQIAFHRYKTCENLDWVSA
jgi:hypothetical protein